MTAHSAAEVQPTTPTPTDPRRTSQALLLGGRLLAARLVWLALALAVTTIFVAGVPVELALLRQTCAGAITTCMPAQLTPSAAHTARSLALTPNGYATILVALDIFSAACWCLVALALFLRRSSNRMAIFSALTLITFGSGRLAMAPSALALAYPQWALAVDGARFLGSACLSIFVFVFPGGHFTPSWTRWIALAWITPQLGEFFLPGTQFDLTRASPTFQFAGFLGFAAAAVFAQVHRYRHISTPLQQRQTRWVVFGVSVSLVGYLTVAFALPLFAPSVTQSGTAANFASVLATTLVMLPIPLTIGIAILRAQLFDIDILINRALVYGTLTTILAALYTGGVVGLQWMFGRFIPGSQLAIVACTLGAIALFQPMRLRIQHAIDRGFYRRKYDAAKTLAAFSATLRSEFDLDELRMHLLTAVRHTMHPAHASLWLLPSNPAEVHTHTTYPGDRSSRQGDRDGHAGND